MSYGCFCAICRLSHRNGDVTVIIKHISFFLNIYYHICISKKSMIDLSLLERGISYQELKECYIIFICTFDPFGGGRHKYTFQNLCREDQNIILQDESVKVFFNTKGTLNDVTDDVKELLQYLDTKETSNDLTRKLDEEVEKARSNKMWRREYMKSLLYEMDIRNEGREEGREEGIKALINVCRKFQIPEE